MKHLTEPEHRDLDGELGGGSKMEKRSFVVVFYGNSRLFSCFKSVLHAFYGWTLATRDKPKRI